MKKIFGISLLGLVILVFGVLPLLMGILAQRAMVQAMNANLPANSPMTYQLVSYQRHWFTSDVVYTLTSKSLALSASQTTAPGQPNANANMPIGITVTETVYHGPIVFTRNLDESWRVYVGQAVAKGTITANPAGSSFQQFFQNTTVTAAGSFQELTTLGLTGHLSVTVAIPALTMSSTSSANVLKTSPLRVFASTNHSMKNFGFGFDVPTLTVLNQGNPVFTTSNLDMRARVRKSPEQLFLGQATVQIADMTSTMVGGRHIDLQDFKITAQSDINRKLLDSDSQLSFARLTVDNKEFGPGVAKLSFKRFDPKAQAELAKLNSYATPQTPWAQAAMLQEASRLFSKLIAHGAQIIASPINVKTSDGDVNLGLTIAFPNVKGQKVSLPMQIRDTNATFQLTLPKALAHRVIDATNRRQIQVQIGAGAGPNGATNIDAMVTAQRTNEINNWIGRGFVVSSGDNYTLKLSYKQGTAYVNGKALKELFGGSGVATTTIASTGVPIAGTALTASGALAPTASNQMSTIPTPVVTTPAASAPTAAPATTTTEPSAAATTSATTTTTVTAAPASTTTVTAAPVTTTAATPAAVNPQVSTAVVNQSPASAAASTSGQ